MEQNHRIKSAGLEFSRRMDAASRSTGDVQARSNCHLLGLEMIIDTLWGRLEIEQRSDRIKK